ncbi:MAG TPA: hypothetical protein PKC03_12395, partial [Dokdonella sp.]|nr:hypothetical protein [Dokdonella sp.]
MRGCFTPSVDVQGLVVAANPEACRGDERAPRRVGCPSTGKPGVTDDLDGERGLPVGDEGAANIR